MRIKEFLALPKNTYWRTFAFGMRPLGPSTLAALPTRDIISGVATHRSKSMLPGTGGGEGGGRKDA